MRTPTVVPPSRPYAHTDPMTTSHAKARVMHAQHDGSCAVCGGPYRIGDLIEVVAMADLGTPRQRWLYRHPTSCPPSAREPHCIHYGGERQPASACQICKDGRRLQEWKDGWAAWIAEKGN